MSTETDEILEIKDCAFQYAYTKGTIFRETKIVCDRSNLTYSEAKDLFFKYKKEIISILQNKNEFD